MVGRSLLSFLAIAAVAIAQVVLPPGKYEISQRVDLRRIPLDVKEARIGAQLVLDRNLPEYRGWHLEPNYDLSVAIRLDYEGSRPLYAAPIEKAEGAPVKLQKEPFYWNFYEGDGGYILVRADTVGSNEPLALGRALHSKAPYVVDNQAYDGNPKQVWTFTEVKEFEQESRSHCGPKRIQRGSFYLQ
ncbi:hypothetical protein B0O80DRAFT_466772 [Mortierella sp. GBAus27b]|nr:hypothetical protein BGX31_005408 [Mortierella sp. GBA43]KAI8346823.1 hypothetical protein B0O80DRAFT_466772 [Mortierella sp. GBAus27b]